MKLIKLNKGYVTKVSDEDYEYLSKWNWWVYDNKRGHRYVVTKTQGVTLKMHRVVLKIEDDTMIGDHIDGDGLNNTRENLRIVTIKQNNANRRRHKIGASKYMGVSISPNGNGWRARCSINGKSVSVYSKTEVGAALAYNELAEKIHGEYACPNIIPENEMEEYKIYLQSLPAKIPDIATHKTCRKCNVSMDRNQFCKSKKNKDGKWHYCKICDSKRVMKRYKYEKQTGETKSNCH